MDSEADLPSGWGNQVLPHVHPVFQGPRDTAMVAAGDRARKDTQEGQSCAVLRCSTSWGPNRRGSDDSVSYPPPMSWEGQPCPPGYTPSPISATGHAEVQTWNEDVRTKWFVLFGTADSKYASETGKQKTAPHQLD